MIRTSIFLLLFFLTGLSAHAAKRYWVAASASTWNSTANWSSTSGGAGGSSVPTSSDTAYFDGGATGNDTLNANVNVKRLEIAAGYTGTIVQGTYTVTIGTSGAVLSGGTFAGGSGSITASGAFTISGCAFTSTSGTLTLGGNYTLSSGSFTHNNGKVKFTTTSTITGTTNFYQLAFAPTVATATFTITSGTNLIANDDFSYEGTQFIQVNGDTIKAKAGIYLSNTATGTNSGSAILYIDGTGNQTLNGNTTVRTSIPVKVYIKKMATDTLFLANTISIRKDWILNSGIVSAGTSTIFVTDPSSNTISGNQAFYNLTFNAISQTSATIIASGTTVTVTNTLTFSGSQAMSLNTGNIHAKGNISVTSTSSAGGGSALLTINGTGNQSFSGSSTSGTGLLCNIDINKPSGTLTLSNKITARGNWTYTAGTVDEGTSTVIFFSTKTISGSMEFFNLTFDGGGGSTHTISSGSILTVLGTLTLGGNGANTYNTGTIHTQGDITILNTSVNTAGSATIVINGTTDQILTGSGTAGGGRLPHVTINKTGGTLHLASLISVTGNWNYVQGTVNASSNSSTVAFYGTTLYLDGQGSGGVMAFHNVSINGGTTTLIGNLDLNNNLTISSGATLSAGSYTINVGGRWNNNNGTWTYSTGNVVFDGSSYIGITRTSGGAPATETFYDLGFNRSGGSVALSSPVVVNHALTLTKGRIKTTSSNYLELIDNATCTTANDSAYVHGPVRKTGNDAFTFPLGDTALHDSIAYHPLAMTAPGVSTDQFEAYYRAAAQTQGDSLVDSLASISTCEHWNVERKAGSSNVTVTLNWNRNSCNVDNYADLRVSGWNGTKWLDFGAATIAGGPGTGSVTASMPLNFISQAQWNVVIGSRPNYQPYAILKRKLDAGFYQVADGKLMFRFDEEYNDPDGKLTFRIYNDAHFEVGNSADVSPGYEPMIYYGSNYYLINILSCTFFPNGTLGNGYYILEVINDKSEHWYLRFEHTTTIQINCEQGQGG